MLIAIVVGLVGLIGLCIYYRIRFNAAVTDGLSIIRNIERVLIAQMLANKSKECFVGDCYLEQAEDLTLEVSRSPSGVSLLIKDKIL